jgi:hypothetical protein
MARSVEKQRRGAAGWRKRKDLISGPGRSVAVREGRGKMGWRRCLGQKKEGGPVEKIGPSGELGRGGEKEGKGKVRGLGGFFSKSFQNSFSTFQTFEI